MIPKLDAEFQRRVHLGDSFTCDSYVFRRGIHQGEYQEVRILHAGRLLPAAQPQMLDVLEYMGSEGFIQAEYSIGNQYVKPSFCPDVVLIGCLSGDVEHIKDVISELEQNHGIFREWDVLLYFIDDKVPPETFKILGRGGIASQYEFADDAKLLLHGHLRRRYDVISRRGVYTTVDRILSESLDHITKPDKDKDTLGKKVRRAVGVLETHQPNDDVATVIKYLILLLSMRNWNAHPTEEHAFKKRMEAWKSVRTETIKRQYLMARVHDANRPKRPTADEQAYHDNLKHMLVLTYKIKNWLIAYAKATSLP